MRNTTPEQLDRYVAELRRVLLENDDVYIDVRRGSDESVKDGWVVHNLNGTMTIEILVNGGERNTELEPERPAKPFSYVWVDSGMALLFAFVAALSLDVHTDAPRWATYVVLLTVLAVRWPRLRFDDVEVERRPSGSLEGDLW
jgi:hypothetical protein